MNRLTTTYGLLLSALLAACSEDILVEQPTGGFQLSIAGVSSDVTATRATPHDLGVPAAEDFLLKIVRNENNAVLYNRTFTSERIPAAAGNYTITVSHGDNPEIGRNTPYYEGKTTATVEAGSTEPTQVSVPARVANALVSVRFGSDATETDRKSVV